LRAVDFHALPFDGDVLLARRAVVYGLDVPVRAAAPPAAVRRALVVGDAEGNLPGARGEARRAAAALAAGPRGWTVELLLGGAAAGPAVRRALPESAWFHYAGHAVAAGWDGSLPLSGGSRLGVEDVLALPRAPAWVVLSGCDTAMTAAESAVESMSLAHAFVSAGSRAVVAAVRPLPDRETAAIIGTFYRELASAPSPGEALRRAQLARRGHPGREWASFRIYVP
jgi:CHAT domain-containing protein